MQKREQQEKLLNVGHSIALQAVELPPCERQAYIKSEVANFRQSYRPVYPDGKFLDSMEEWVTEMVKILAVDESPNGVDRRQ